jgi:hypothetical protein
MHPAVEDGIPGVLTQELIAVGIGIGAPHCIEKAERRPDGPYFARSTKRPSRVSRRILSPGSTYEGSMSCRPVSTVPGFS